MPRALVTNDDGIDSPGLHALAAAAREAGLDVVVAAPSEQSSGAGAAPGRMSPRPGPSGHSCMPQPTRAPGAGCARAGAGVHEREGRSCYDTTRGRSTNARSSGSGEASATTRSTARHSMCRAARCISCTVAVSPGRHTASTQASANGLGPGPVTAQLVTFSADAAAAASTRFSLRPLVENISRMSPGRAWARTWRA